MDANAFAALADPTRAAILERLKDGPRAVGELAKGMPVTRPAVSQHLKVLKEAGLVAERRSGTRRLYRIDPQGVWALRQSLEGLWEDALESFRATVEHEEHVEVPITKEVVVPGPVERAWALFTERVGDWWPFAGHSIGGERACAAHITPERVYEVWDDGSERVWGHTLVWEPPSRVVFTWEVSADSGNEVEVRFTPEVAGTRIALEHRGWENGTPAAWQGYDRGWDAVLGCYEAAVV